MILDSCCIPVSAVLTWPPLYLMVILNLLSMSSLEYYKLYVCRSIVMDTLPDLLMFLTIQSPTTRNANNAIVEATEHPISWRNLFDICFFLDNDDCSRTRLNWFVNWEAGYLQSEIEAFSIIIWEIFVQLLNLLFLASFYLSELCWYFSRYSFINTTDKYRILIVVFSVGVT